MAAAAAYRVEEDQLWKCPKHPSKRRRNGGICPTCLRDRLDNLCPNCCRLLPCPCVPAAVSSSSSSSCSSSLGGGENSFRRSRSLAIPFLRSNTGRANSNSNTPSFLSAFRRSKLKKTEEKSGGCDLFNGDESNEKIENFAEMITITRSRSVSVGTTSSSGLIGSSSSAKGKFWLFPGRMSALRRSKNPKTIAKDRSPLHRG